MAKRERWVLADADQVNKQKENHLGSHFTPTHLETHLLQPSYHQQIAGIHPRLLSPTTAS